LFGSRRAAAPAPHRGYPCRIKRGRDYSGSPACQRSEDREHPNQLPAARYFDAQKFLRRKHKGMLLIHRRDVIEPIEIANRLQIGPVLDQLFSATMEQSNVRIDALHNLAIEFQDEAQNPVRHWVLRPKIDCEVPA
jgi:hypothetical protein